MMNFPLEENDVHIWHAAPEDLRRQALPGGLLSPDEIDRQRRFSSEAAALLHRIGRVLVRTTLSRYEDIPPSAWRFRYGPRGRPEVASPLIDPPLRFSLSHTDGMAVCAVARGMDVGVDLENLSRSCRFEQVARRFFPPAEVRDMESLPREMRPRRFFEYWTLREACLKAGGWGLSLPLNRIAFRLLEDGAAAASFDPSLGEDPAQWRFRLIPLPPGHMAALAVRGREKEDLRITVRYVKQEEARP